ncbi:MAG: RagB/SusD family nutrient uptake outer membrane protein [Bacteroides sp.]
MKNFILLIVIAIFSGCTLQTTPSDIFTQDNFWKTEEQYNAGLIACYSTLRSNYLYGDVVALFPEVLTPNAYLRMNNYGFMVIAEGTHTSVNSVIIQYRWKACYEGIGRCNTYLQHADNAPIAEEMKERMKAEAKFLRALYYSILTQHYGDAPLITDAPNVSEQANLPRSPKKEIIEQIAKDLQEAAPALNLTYSTTNVGRATRGAAYALLGRVYLYNNEWQKAADNFKKVIDLKQYSLFNHYRKLFAIENENNSEVIFDVQFKNPEQRSSIDLVLRAYDTCAPLLDLLQCYEKKDGTAFVPGVDPLYKNRDPRMDFTIVHPGSQYMGATVTDTQFSSTGCTFKKFSRYDTEYAPVYDYNDINYIVIRYADVLLGYAEALNELNKGNEALPYLNSVRERPSVNMPSIPTGKTQSELRKIIRHERRVELAGEGLYYNDIIRWKIAEKLMNGPIYKVDGTKIMNRFFDASKHYLWPVPNEQVTINKNLLPNNPNW